MKLANQLTIGLASAVAMKLPSNSPPSLGGAYKSWPLATLLGRIPKL